MKYLAISLAVFWAFAYGIGVARRYKATKEFLAPDGKYFSGIFKALSVLYYALAGKTPLDKETFALDNGCSPFSVDQINYCVEQARKTMIALGAKTSAYKVDQFDCNSYARLMSALCILHARIAYPLNPKASPFFVFVYTKENGRGHAILKAVDKDGNAHYFEPYPDEPHFKKWSLTPREIDSCRFEI